MSKKAAPKKKTAAGAADADDVDYNENLRQNYKKACTALGLQAHPSILKALNNEEDPAAPILQICTDTEVGGAGVRAFCAALLGKGLGMKPTGYKHLRTARFWRSDAGDSGVAAMAEVLRNGRDEVRLQDVEFMDSGVGVEGCAALGDALMLGANASLATLRLDLNPGIGDAGTAQLCRGLRTNRTLTALTLSFCGIQPDGAAALAAVLASPLSALVRLDLMGNHLGSEGLGILARAACRSRTLTTLNLRDNGIGAGTLITYVARGYGGEGRGGAGGGGRTGELDMGPGIGGGALSSSSPARAGAGASIEGPSPHAHLRHLPPPSVTTVAAATSMALRPSAGGGVAGSPAQPTFAATAAAAGLGLTGGSTRVGGDSAAFGGIAATFMPALAEDAAVNATAAAKAALEELGRALADAAVPLHSVDLEMNGLTGEEAAVLVPFLKDNAKVKMLKVDTTLPPEVFAVLCRSGVTAVKKKKKVASKKKKK